MTQTPIGPGRGVFLSPFIWQNPVDKFVERGELVRFWRQLSQSSGMLAKFDA
jgi:hypothetical protein